VSSYLKGRTLAPRKEEVLVWTYAQKQEHLRATGNNAVKRKQFFKRETKGSQHETSQKRGREGGGGAARKLQKKNKIKGAWSQTEEMRSLI